MQKTGRDPSVRQEADQLPRLNVLARRTGSGGGAAAAGWAIVDYLPPYAL